MSSFTNSQISNLLNNVSFAYQAKSKTLNDPSIKYKIAKYKEIADVIDRLPVQLIDLYKEGTLENNKLLGKNILGYIIELFKTGHVKHFDEIKQELPPVFFELIKLRGIGPKTAFRLIDELNINTLEDLSKSSFEGFGEKTKNKVLEALKEYRSNKDVNQRYLLRNALILGEYIIDYLKKSKHVINAVIVGSARRRRETVGDLDIAISTYDKDEAINHFLNYSKIIKVISSGKTGATTVILSSGHQVDLRISDPQSFGSLLVHFTGSKFHNIKLRELSLSKGYSLSEEGAKSSFDIVKFDKEVDLYHFYGLQWIPPELREGGDEFVKKIPELIKLTDIRGDLHLHSNYPIETAHDYGKHSIEEIVKKAISLNYEYVCISDHNPNISKHDGDQYYQLIKSRTELIRSIERKYKFRIYNMLEIDILPNGDLAINEESLNLLDACLVSIHSSFLMSKQDMTQRVLKGLSHDKAKIFAHPSARILLKRVEINLDWDVIFDFCEKHDKALEINASYDRLDLNSELIKETKAKLIISSDAHSLNEMDQMIYGIYTARRGWCTKERIFNTRDEKEFTSWIMK
jgi:DNA polymerase (family 10)